jgi:hypothetical protein
MEFVVIPSQDGIQWTELEQPWRGDPVSHTATEAGLVFAILVLEDGADQNQVRVRGAQNPLPIISNIHMRNRRSKPRERSLGHPHGALGVEPDLAIDGTNDDGTIPSTREAVEVGAPRELMALRPVQHRRLR